jgi:hypothetical protein
MSTDSSGNWIGYGVGDSDDPTLARTAPNWHAVTLINDALAAKYSWARALGVVESPHYTTVTAAAISEFCSRTGLPVVLDANGSAVANLAIRKRLGSYPAPTPILPLFFTVEGHSSDMFSGPVADTASQLESEGLCHHMPTGYDNGAIPFDNNSGVSELARRLSQTVQDNGVLFPAGTPWMLGTFSQGGIVGYDFYAAYLAPGTPLEFREEDRLGTLAYGDPCRATGSIAPWAVGQISNTGTHGLDPYKRYGAPGCPALPPNFMDDYREGDIFAENDGSLEGQMKAAVYQAVARGNVFGGTTSLATEIANTFKQPLQSVVAIFEAIISGIVFLGDNPSPHYSPYDISGGVNWARSLLSAQAAPQKLGLISLHLG